MADYHQEWTRAKQTFESATGANKPAPIGTVPLVKISYRKGTGIDDELKTIDKLIPAQLQQGLDGRPMQRLEQSMASLSTHVMEYLALLEREIAQAKGVGKVDTQYRDLKILRASLQGITAKVNLDIQKLKAFNSAQHNQQAQVEVGIRTAADGIRSAGQDGLLWGQRLLQQPTAALFNALINTKSRNISQPLAQLRKWAMPDAIGAVGMASRQNAIAQAPTLGPWIDALRVQVESQGLQDDILALLRMTGATTALGASLEELGNKGLKVPVNAPPATVVDATKHFMSLAKAAMQIADRMKGLAVTVRIPAMHEAPLAAADDDLVAPDYQAPLAPNVRRPPDRPAPLAPNVRRPPNLPAPLPPMRPRAVGGPPVKPLPMKPLPKPPTGYK